MRRRLLAASALSTPVSGEAVSARLLQALPQLSFGQLLQEFNNQTPPWRGFAGARQDSTENAARDSAAISDATQAEETSGLLLASSREQSRSSSPPRSRRRGSSGAPLYSMGAAGDFERSDSTTSPLQTMEDDTAGLAGALPVTQAPDPSRPRRNTEEESDDQTAMDELQALFRRCHNSLPFVALFLIYFAYQHATGILVLVVGTVAVMGLDQRMRSQIALKDQASTWHLLCIVGMCAIDMVALCSVDGDPNPLRHFAKILQTNAAHSNDSSGGVLGTGGIFWQVLWTVLVNGRRIFALARSFVTLGLEFGAYVSHDELMEAGSPDCSICYEAMRQPVKLPCSHMFCEECVTEWFDRERSCPLCRASVGPSSLTADDGIKPQYLDGRTSLVPQLL
ncbi:hypothetical protein BBJ28_00019411 [Nothophytophthora sp. Chile5]|nr:hypothetical protein BBJ28_00019411 [Nothophytophthora sp. Chile5]